MRRAACELLRFVAQPSTDHRYRAHAGPVSEAERRAARQPWELHINEGRRSFWCRPVCACLTSVIACDVRLVTACTTKTPSRVVSDDQRERV